MNKIIAFAKLPLYLESEIAWQEVKFILKRETKHFNTAHYSGDWTVVTLRSPGGKTEAIIPEAREGEAFIDTELMETCPTIKRFIQSLQTDIMSVRLLNLKAGAIIKEHRDVDLCFEKGEVRLHIPIFTNNMVEFYVKGNFVHMQETECWYINANLPHKAFNHGTTDRVHLVIDCTVNQWLINIFNSSTLNYAVESIKEGELQKIISELKAQNTETSNNLARQLELK